MGVDNDQAVPARWPYRLFESAHQHPELFRPEESSALRESRSILPSEKVLLQPVHGLGQRGRDKREEYQQAEHLVHLEQVGIEHDAHAEPVDRSDHVADPAELNEEQTTTYAQHAAKRKSHRGAGHRVAGVDPKLLSRQRFKGQKPEYLRRLAEDERVCESHADDAFPEREQDGADRDL